jgi:hypothetical protein
VLKDNLQLYGFGETSLYFAACQAAQRAWGEAGEFVLVEYDNGKSVLGRREDR